MSRWWVIGALLAGWLAPAGAARPTPSAVPPAAGTCFDVAAPSPWCAVAPRRQAAPSFMLLGDSHALQVLPAFEAAARAAGRSGLFAGVSGCPPLQGVVLVNRPAPAPAACAALQAQALATVRAQAIRDVYLVAKWSYSTSFWVGTRYINALGLQAGERPSLEGSRRAFEAGVAATLAAYTAAGARVHVLEQVPQQEVDPRGAQDLALRGGQPPALMLWSLGVPLGEHRALQAFPAETFRRLLPAASILNAEAVFCDARRCSLGRPGRPLYADVSHLNPAGAARLVNLLRRSLSDRNNPVRGMPARRHDGRPAIQ